MGERAVDLNIVCFLWYGNRWKRDDMGAEYVNRLFRGVSRNLNIPHSFICFTNHPKGIFRGVKVIPLDPPSWKGCLPKVYMFNPDLGLKGQIFSLDLDVVIVGSLDDMCSYRGDFCVRSRFKVGQEYKMDGDIVGFRVGFGVDTIWEEFINDPQFAEEMTGGRERYWYRYWVGDCDRWQVLYPGQLISYKRHVRSRKILPENARIVSCHGFPRPHQIKEPWIKEHWI